MNESWAEAEYKRECRNLLSRKWRRENPKWVKAYNKKYRQDHLENCKKAVRNCMDLYQDTSLQTADNYYRRWDSFEDEMLRYYSKSDFCVPEVAILLGRSYRGTYEHVRHLGLHFSRHNRIDLDRSTVAFKDKERQKEYVRNYQKNNRSDAVFNLQKYKRNPQQKTLRIADFYGMKWTVAEIDMLRKLSKTNTYAEAAAVLGRSYYAVQNKARKMHLHFIAHKMPGGENEQ
jgi:hypothetical protein